MSFCTPQIWAVLVGSVFRSEERQCYRNFVHFLHPLHLTGQFATIRIEKAQQEREQGVFVRLIPLYKNFG